MDYTILVTGSTGNVGSQVVKQLSSFKGKVLAAVQSKNRAEEVKNTGAELVEMNFNNTETISAAFKGIQALFLLTPFVPNMIEISDNLVEQAKKANVNHIVKQSAFGSDTEQGITMNRLHREVEKIIESSGINYTFLRPMSFMQNYLGLADSIKTQGWFSFPLGDSKTSFVDTRDIAAVAVQALTKSSEHRSKTYNLTGPEAISNYEIAETLSNIAGRKITYVDVSADDARKRMKNSGMQEWSVDSLMELFGFQKGSNASVVSPDVERVTGRKPISFVQFATDYAELFRPS
ncbi:MAG: SDR family oxidoreductase [Nitrososphaeraceae archaeon]|nr:SDR family oxidoreductase [Nitrososphaeraceae archaeon]MBV9666774.1 SDR family oxidoreductase [Nitrososphaeraceae archaeon]